MMTPTSPRQAYSYLRFSTPEQMSGDSYRRQMEATRRFAAERGWQLSEVPFFDKGVSAYRGSNAREGKLGEFLEAVESGKVPKGSVLVIEALDRLSRQNPWSAIGLLGQIIKAGVSVATSMNGRVYGEEAAQSDNPLELMEIVVLLSQSHEESRKKSERHKANWEGKRLKAESGGGKPMTAMAPAWLRISKDRQSFEIIPDRVEIVERIFKDYLEGSGTHSIAARLNEEGVTPFGRARLWHRSYVLKIIDNRSVLGEFTPHTIAYDDQGKRSRVPLSSIPNYYPAIIPKETFASASVMRSAKRAPSGRRGRASVSYVLAGLAKCPKCRSAMVRVNKGSGSRGGKAKLVCYRAKSKAGCTMRSVLLEDVEAAIFGSLDEFAMHGDPGTSAQVLDSITKQEDRKAVIEKKLQRLIRMATDGEDSVGEVLEQVSGTMPSVASEIRKLEKQRKEIEGWLQTVNIRLNTLSASTISARLKDLREEAHNEEPNVVRINALLRQLVSRVVIAYDENEMRFHWHGSGVTRLPVHNL